MQEDGQPLRAHLESLHRQSGVLPELLGTAPELPEFTEDVWRHFVNLSNERTEGRITSTMMRDYQWSEGITLQLWQRKALKRLDRISLEPRD